MRKWLPLVLFVLFAGNSWAQTASFTVVSAPCNNNGVLKVFFSGVTPPVTVTWTTQGSNGMPIVHTGVSSLSDVLTSYSGGPLTIVARDSSGAFDSGYFAGVPPFGYSFNVLPSICPAPDTVSYTVAGGTPPYAVQWYNMSTLATVATTNPAILPQGNYGITLTDGSGCSYGSKVDPSFATLSSSPSFTLSASSTTANCTDGTASVITIGGGVAPYSYQWSNGATTPTISNLVTGTYDVELIDAQGCGGTTSVFVPQAVSIGINPVPTPATCLDTNGAITTFPSGGTPPYTYLWSNGMTTPSQTGLVAGTYSVTVTDVNGCIGTDFAVVGASTPISVTYSSSPSLCTTPTGNATVTVSGATSPYSINWHTTPAQFGVTATSLIAGDYYFKITDVLGCVQEGVVNVPPVDVISLTLVPVAALCTLSNGSMNVIPSGGVAPYSYAWSNGSTASSITGVPSGTYQLTVTDNLGCKTTTNAFLDSYSPVTVGVMSTPASCIFTADGMNTATPFGGTPPYTYGWSSGGATSTISALPYGPYWVSVTDATGCTSGKKYSYVRYDASATNCSCTIQGTVFNDLNTNCVQDPGEAGLPNVQIYVSGRGYTYTDDSGFYSYLVPSGSYTVTETMLPYNHLAPCQINSIPITITTGVASCTNTVNFANTRDTVHDIHISTWDYTRAVPGHVYTQAVVVTNEGSVAEDSIHVSYRPDGQFFPAAFTPSAIFTGAPYTYEATGTFPALNSGRSQTIYMNYHVPTNIPMATTVVFKDSAAVDTPMSTWLTDYTPWNNVNSITTKTVSSFDPNFKEVYPQGTGTTGLISYKDSILEYMVHFQNTGSAMAENVTVIDTLDDNLNWTSLRPTHYSAPCKITMQQAGARKIVTFTFNNINLPTAASNPMGSNGMFTYTIHIKPGLAVGAQFRNRASIYFDYNAPVITNSTLNTLQSTNAVTNVSGENAYQSFTVYPNPASQSFNAIINSEKESAGDMVITDLTGKTLVSKHIAIQKGKQTINTDVSTFAPGIYFVTINDNGKVQTQKLVIMK